MQPRSDVLSAVLSSHRVPEEELVRSLLAEVVGWGARDGDVRARAVALLRSMREAQSRGLVNRFLVQFGLSSEEGLAMLALAEAFLRVPDARTASALIADKLGPADWRSHAGASSSALVNSATWGLVLTSFLVGADRHSGALRRLVARAGEPFVRVGVKRAMAVMGSVFVMGRTIEEALRRMERPDRRGFTASFDMLGEAARTNEDAERYFQSYRDAIRRIGAAAGAGHSISVKLSALEPRYETAHFDAAVKRLSDRLSGLCREAAGQGIGLTVDAEEADRLEMSLAILADVAQDRELAGWDGLGFAVQAYSRRARATVAWADDLGQRTGRRLAVRLVKGAYWDTEIKIAQERGLGTFPVFTRKASTDLNYLACAHDMLRARHIRPAFASHNALTVATICEWAGASRDLEFQRLHGMGDGLYEGLVRDEGFACRIYAPVGSHRELLAYLVRRLLENGANSSFVHQLADETRSEDEILADPVATLAACSSISDDRITPPRDLFGPERINSGGIDLQSRAELAALAADVWSRAPAGAGLAEGPPQLGPGEALETCAEAFPAWRRVPVEERASRLRALADLLEENRVDLIADLVHEARKTMADALAEVREAVDFCRYYADRACELQVRRDLPGPTGETNVHLFVPRGVWLAVSPWNFPLAIFLGQVVAALVTGNCVVAKPAPQTPLVARRARALAVAAGIPERAFQLVEGGPEVGAALVCDRRVDGVAFTGSTATARRIALDLLSDAGRPLVPLIAETGGINAMIVDSTALPEQVVRDVVVSAFQSAGQRCSALRLLLLQEEVADEILRMLSGAMDTLVLGDPALPATDVGPVIDRASYDRLMAYRESRRSDWLKTVPSPEHPLVVPPTLIRNSRVEDLDRELFGPILHVATWRAGGLRAALEAVNASGYGLTLGLHSRIRDVADLVAEEARVGNIYVNRSMIGAVVGSQPFGGEGLSGTGPKAGGPNYLQRFCSERVVSTDTTSAGGNAQLFTMGAQAH